MKRDKRINRGFTLTELIIVIVIIGVLAAILIPTFISVKRKSMVAADLVTVDGLNKIISTSENEINNYEDLVATIEKGYGVAFLQTLAPKSAKIGNHFWYDNAEQKVILSKIDDLDEKEYSEDIFNCPNSNIVYGYTLLDTSGSDLANILYGISNICTRSEVNELVLKAQEMFNNGSEHYITNLIDYLSNTAIVNSSGSFRFSDIENVNTIYFPNRFMSLGSDIVYTYDIDSDSVEAHKISFGYPIIGSGFYGQIIDIPSTMYFGSKTFVVEEDCNITLHVDVNKIEELKDVFAAEATNCLIKINSNNNVYRIVEDTIVDEIGLVVFEGLEYSISKDLLGDNFPSISSQAASASVDKNIFGSTKNDANIVTASGISAIIPKGTKVNNSQLTLEVTPMGASESNLVLSGYATQSIDVHIEGISTKNTTPIIIYLGRVLYANLNGSAIKLYHIENNKPVLMQKVTSLSELNQHNSYYYDVNTGEVTIAVNSFSEILLAKQGSNSWAGGTDTSWYNDSDSKFTLSTADQLAGLAQLVNKGNTFENKTIELANDIVINDWKIYGHGTGATKDNPVEKTIQEIAADNDLIWYDPADSLENQGRSRDTDYYPYYFTPIGNRNNPFKGTFDGKNWTISGLFDIDCWHDWHSVGVFGYVYNATIKNLNVDNCYVYSEFCRIGLIACNATGDCIFDNLAIHNNYLASYNEYVGGIIANYWYVKYSDNTVENCHCTVSNCKVDNTNTLSALWGTYDCCLGGIIGGVDDDGSIVDLVNCIVYCTLDAYNDCCANYQWFQYRYCGMLVGWAPFDGISKVREGTINCTNCKVAVGDWNQYYYYKWPLNGKPSYASEHDWKYSRYSESNLIKTNGVVTGGYVNYNNDRISIDQAYTNLKGQTINSRGNDYTITTEDFDRLCYLPLTQLFGSGNGGGTVGRYGVDDYDGVEHVDYNTLVSGGSGEVTTTGTITKKLSNTNFMYRVGNKNNIYLTSLFTIEDNTGFTYDNITISIESIEGAEGSWGKAIDENVNSWNNDYIKFDKNKTGVARVTLSYGNKSLEYVFEVVDGYNATSKLDAINCNVCLLNNISINGNAGITIQNGYSFYGNGLKIICTGDGKTNPFEGMKSGYIIVDGGTLENVSVIAPDFPKAYMYTTSSSGGDYIVSEKENKTTDTDKDRYAYQLSAIKVSMSSRIANSYVYGARNNIYISDGDVTIDNCFLVNGALANIQFEKDRGSLNLINVTTIQYLRSFSYKTPNGESTKDATVFGMGILVGLVPGTGTGNGNPEINVSGYFNQFNWACSNYGDSVTSSKTAKNLVTAALGYDDYTHYDQGGTKWVNLGIVFLNKDEVKINNIINDNGYKLETVSMSGVSGQVYSIGKDYGSIEIKDSSYIYDAADYSIYIPKYILNIGTEPPASGESGCYWNDTNKNITINFPKNDTYIFDYTDYIGYLRYTGEDVLITISLSGIDDSQINGSEITFTTNISTNLQIHVTGSHVYALDGNSYVEGGYTLSIPIEVVTTKVSPNAVITCTSNSGTMIWGSAGSSWDRDYQPAAQIFDNMTITDYDSDGNPYTVLDGDNQSKFLNSIASVTADSDNKTGFTISFPDGTKLVIKCGAPYNSGTLQFKQYNNKFLMCGSKAYNNPTAATWNVTSYTYTGRNGIAVSYNTKRSFTSTTNSTNYSLSDLSTNKFLIYDVQGGDVSPAYASTSPATLPTPTREGYVFLNWNTKADGTGTARNAGTSMSFSSTTTLYAIWQKEINVQFISGYEVVDEISGGAGINKTLPSINNDNYYIEGWYTEEYGEGTRIGSPSDSFTMPNENTTYYAYWVSKINVSFNANGGSVSPESCKYAGTPITLPTPTNGSKTFEGWFTASEGGTKVGTAGDSYIPGADITLYAQWSDNILVTFDGNGGTSGTNSATYDHVTPITLPSATWTGHQFNGWYTAASGGTKAGTAGDSYAPIEATTLYAQWTAYTVSFDGNGATNPSSLSSGSNGSVTLPTPTRIGYTFNGWYTATSGGTKIGDAGASYTPTENITLHAQWTQQKFTVTISAGSGGSVSPTSIANVPYGTTVTVNSNKITINGTTVTATASSNYTFDKWSVSNGVTITSATTITASFKSSSSCLLPNTLITLADGTQKEIQYLVPGDMLMVFNHETGKLDIAPVTFNEKEEEQLFTVIHLVFDNGANIGVISEHGFFDLDTMRYEYIDETNYQNFVGHHFYTIDGNSTILIDAYQTEELTEVYSLPTFYHLNSFSNNILSMPGGITGLFNIFEYADDLQYDEQAMNEDIENYGLLTIDDLAPYGVDEIMFEAYAGKYLSVALGKGILTEEYLMYLIDRYGGYTE